MRLGVINSRSWIVYKIGHRSVVLLTDGRHGCDGFSGVAVSDVTRGCSDDGTSTYSDGAARRGDAVEKLAHNSLSRDVINHL